MLNSYVGAAFTERFSFVVEDGWCDTGGQGFGDHCFTDFGSNYIEAREDVAYESESYSPGNPPFPVAVFRLLSLLDYNHALFIWLAMIGLSSVALAVFVARFVDDWAVKFLIFTILGIANVGTISSLDRGNPIPAITAGIFFSILIAEKNKSSLFAPFILGIVASIKFWTPLFFLYFVVRRKWQTLILGSSVWLILSVGSLVISPKGFWTGMDRHLFWLTNRDYGLNQLPASHSIYSFVQRVSCSMAKAPPECFTEGFLLPDYSAVAMGLGLIAIMVALSVVWRNLPYLPAVPLSLLPVIALPEAMVYNLSLFNMSVGLLILLTNGPFKHNLGIGTRGVINLILGGCLISMAIIPVRLDHWFNSPLSSIYVPLIFSFVCLWVLVEFLKGIFWSRRRPGDSYWFKPTVLADSLKRDK